MNIKTSNEHASSSSTTDSCENCSSNFNLFKRKKLCSFCNLNFCQFCVNRFNRSNTPNPSTTNSNNTTSSNERICTICKGIIEPSTNTEDLIKLKVKHLRAFLNTAGIPTTTCRDKQDLVDLVIRVRQNYNKPSNSNTNQQQQQQQQHQQQPNQQTPSFFSNIMNNFQDLIASNLNPINNPIPCPPPAQQATTNTFSNTNPYPSTNSSIPTNINSAFNLFTEQIPNLMQQTFNANLFNQNPQNSSEYNASQSNVNRNAGSTSTLNRGEDQTFPRAFPSERTSEPNNSSNTDTRNISNANPSNSNINTSSSVNSNQTKRRASLSDIKFEDDIENLNIKQIKEILANNFVEYKGCCEKKELVDKLKQLYKSNLENKQKEKEINERAQTANDTDICKICMESIIDCVLLECGHMVSCIKCGKQLAECPICRQNVVRVLRVFRS